MEQAQKKQRKKITPTLMFKLFLLVIALLFIFNTSKYIIQRIKLQSQINELNNLIAQEEDKRRLYTEELNKVGTAEYYEYLARKYLGYIYPDETVIVNIEDRQ